MSHKWFIFIIEKKKHKQFKFSILAATLQSKSKVANNSKKINGKKCKHENDEI